MATLQKFREGGYQPSETQQTKTGNMQTTASGPRLVYTPGTETIKVTYTPNKGSAVRGNTSAVSQTEKAKAKAPALSKNSLPGSAVSRGADKIVDALTSSYSEEDAKPTGWGQVAKGTLLKGADQFVTGLTSTGKMVEGWITKPLEKATGVEGLAESSPWAVLDRVMKNAQQYNTDQFQKDFESKGKVGEILDKYGTATVAAVPQAALALMTAGSSLGAQAGGAGLQAAGASSGLASTIGSAASTVSNNPQFWLSVAQTAGPAYEEAKADGATDAQASSYALLTSLVNSVVEVGGGIDTLPAELQQAARGGKSGLKVWFNGMLDEGKEEVIQGAISQMSQSLYGKQNPIFSTTDQNAVISPSRAADEFLGGAVVGGVLGGGQIAANRIINRAAQLPTVSQTQEENVPQQIRENTASPQDGPAILQTGTQAEVNPVQDVVQTPESSALPLETAESVLEKIQGKRKPFENYTREQQNHIADKLWESGAAGVDASGNVFRQYAEQHIDNRTAENVASREVNAFQYDWPHLQRYTKDAAQSLLNDADISLQTPSSARVERTTQGKKYKRSILESDPVRQAMNMGLSRNDIITAAQNLINDMGSENNAAAKRLEIVVDNMLTNGYTDIEGNYHGPNQEYIDWKSKIHGAKGEYSSVSEELPIWDVQEPQPLPTTGNEPQSVGAAAAGFDPYSNQLKQYGAIPEGENPYRQIDVPQRTAPDNRVSYSARTILEAAATPDSAVGDIGQAVVDGKFSYIPISNKSAQSSAEATVKRLGYQGALAQFMSDVESGKSSEKVTALGLTLYNNAVNSGDTMGALDIAYQLSKSVRNGARATQAMRILKKLTPSGQLYMIQKEVNDINEQNAEKVSKKSKTSVDNVPVELWMQRVGENLADYLETRTKVPKEKVQSVTQTVLSDLKRYANEIVPKQLPTGKKRTEMDRIMDLFQNKAAYDEAWQAARYTFMDAFEDNPEILSAYDQWLDSSLDYTSRLTKELTGQSEITIDTDLADAFLNASTEAERAAALDAIYQNIAEQVPSTKMDKFNALRYLNMLGNLKTQGRNIFGNTVMMGVRAVENKVRYGMESLVRLRDPNYQRTTTFSRDSDLYQAAKKDFAAFREAALGEQKYGTVGPNMARAIQDRRTIFKNNGTWGTGADSGALARGLRRGTDMIWSGLERYRRATNLALEEGDVFFSRRAYADALARYLQAHGVTADQFRAGNLDPDFLDTARAYAIRTAQEATFRDSNAFSDMIADIGFKDTDNSWKRAANIALQGTIPFRRTPANVAVRAYEYSPAGVISTAVKAAQLSRGSETVTGQEVVESLSKNLTGVGLFLTGMAAFAQGILTAGEDEDEKQADLDSLTGKQAYALTLPDGTSFTLDWMSPSIMPMAAGAELMRAIEDEDYSLDSALLALGGMTNVMLNMSMLQGVNDQLSNISYSDVPAVDLVLSSLMDYLTQGTTSTLLGQIERTGEDQRMTTYTDKNLPLPDGQYLLGSASARTPGVDFAQIPYIDAWGRMEESEPQPLRTFNQLINPAYVSKANVTPLDEEVQRLYDATGDGGVVPKRAEKTITVNKEDKDLSADEYVRYATEKGQNAYSLASDLISSSVYQSLSDTDKAKMIDTVYDYANALAKHDLFGDTLEGWIEDIYTSGVDPIIAMLYRQSDADAATKRQMLMNDSSLSAEEKSAIDKAVISENSKIDYSSQESFALSHLSDAGQRKWEKAEAWGMPYEDYVKYYPICSAGGKKKDEIIQDLISAGMSERNAYNFWDIIKKD